MPKENTHIYFADGLLARLDNELKKLVKDNIDYFYLGSITPDTFYYSEQKAIVEISDYLHGNGGNLTNELIFDLLDTAKDNKNDKDFVFALGFITHCALDIVWHPVIFYLTGDYHSLDKSIAAKAQYQHRYFETQLDSKVNDKFFISELIKASCLEKLSVAKLFAQKFKLPVGDISNAYTRQINFHKLFKSKFIFSLVYLLNRLKIIRVGDKLALFYGNLGKDKRSWAEDIDYQDLLTGEKQHTNIKELFNKSTELSIKMLKIADDYYQGKINKIEASQVISGQSMTTGKLNTKVSDLKYFYPVK